MEIWITTKIEHNVVSWSKFLEGEMTRLSGFPVYPYHESWDSFSIGEEKKFAVVVFNDNPIKGDSCFYQPAHIFGQDGYLKFVSVREALECGLDELFVISSYMFQV
ncbi:F-box associated ubiquitination effector family protein [Raphanus sativus]|nr:F-box associated ubiquitination effector family protein [Raphanus sativus]